VSAASGARSAATTAESADAAASAPAVVESARDDCAPLGGVLHATQTGRVSAATIHLEHALAARICQLLDDVPPYRPSPPVMARHPHPSIWRGHPQRIHSKHTALGRPRRQRPCIASMDIPGRALTKPTMALAAWLIAAGAGCRNEPSSAPADPSPPTTGASLVADSCAVARPSFGGVATAADRALFAYDVDAPLHLQKTVESTKNGVEVSAITFSSPDGGSVPGLLFDPVDRAGPRPGIVLMHGMPGNARSTAGQGQGLAEHGAVVIAIDAPFARRAGPSLRFITEDRVEQIRLIKDLQRAVDVLRARANVDDDRIAYLGISYGGAMGALFVGVERRLKAAVLVVGDGGLVSHSTGPEDLGAMASLSCAVRVNWLRAMTPIEPIRFLPHAPPTALLLQSGQLDNLVPVADARALHDAAPEPKTIRWYDAGHGLNLQALRDRHEWLNGQIGLDLLR
jgi:dienelactone hydrolase